MTLIGSHAFLGELGAMMFLWVFIELLNPTEQRIGRALKVALMGVLFLFLSWLVGGYYYVNIYGSAVKPLIKAGPLPWTHGIITETKEHVFLFLPFLSVLTLGLIKGFKDSLSENRRAQIAILILAITIVLLAFSIAGMGFLISSGFRAALESKL